MLIDPGCVVVVVNVDPTLFVVIITTGTTPVELLPLGSAETVVVEAAALPVPDDPSTVTVVVT